MTPLQNSVRRKALGTFQRRAYVVELQPHDVIVFRYLRSRKQFVPPLAEVFRIAQVRTVAAERAAKKTLRRRWL